MKKNYIAPELNTQLLSSADVLNGSDVLIDASDLFGESAE